MPTETGTPKLYPVDLVPKTPHASSPLPNAPTPEYTTALYLRALPAYSPFAFTRTRLAPSCPPLSPRRPLSGDRFTAPTAHGRAHPAQPHAPSRSLRIPVSAPNPPPPPPPPRLQTLPTSRPPPLTHVSTTLPQDPIPSPRTGTCTHSHHSAHAHHPPPPGHHTLNSRSRNRASPPHNSLASLAPPAPSSRTPRLPTRPLHHPTVEPSGHHLARHNRPLTPRRDPQSPPHPAPPPPAPHTPGTRPPATASATPHAREVLAHHSRASHSSPRRPHNARSTTTPRTRTHPTPPTRRPLHRSTLSGNAQARHNHAAQPRRRTRRTALTFRPLLLAHLSRAPVPATAAASSPSPLLHPPTPYLHALHDSRARTAPRTPPPSWQRAPSHTLSPGPPSLLPQDTARGLCNPRTPSSTAPPPPPSHAAPPQQRTAAHTPPERARENVAGNTIRYPPSSLTTSIQSLFLTVSTFTLPSLNLAQFFSFSYFHISRSVYKGSYSISE
ncbi:hypothetical protein BT96DRAFT_1008844 [Gymnopus androsaceus JB14]|uniref:Uncharacterized protein n=1 Tax=Gymnopus androsaceus JB14 TaxID=1447944 RepID=A0A6A4GEC6_9AGAR|nr:hypothetical protein BT96DRAFT_1008844 [Gymnopus androsaceus JB14]